MRFVAGIAGILLGVPPFIFFSIGARTFNRTLEKALAVGVTLETGALLLLSVALFFTPSVQRVQAAFLFATLITMTAILLAHRFLR